MKDLDLVTAQSASTTAGHSTQTSTATVASIADLAEPLPLPCCQCMSSCESFLYKHRCCTAILGLLVYLPMLTILYILWIIQLPLTIIFNLFLKIFCCDCRCLSCCLKKYQEKYILPKEKLADTNHDMMNVQGMIKRQPSRTHASLRDSFRRPLSHEVGTDINGNDNGNTSGASSVHLEITLASTSMQSSSQSGQSFGNVSQSSVMLGKSKSNEDKDVNTGDEDPNGDYFSVLQMNLFGMYGRYWNRYPLWTSIVNSNKPDIICGQEGLPSRWFPIGTISKRNKSNGQGAGGDDGSRCM